MVRLVRDMNRMVADCIERMRLSCLRLGLNSLGFVVYAMIIFC